MGHVHPWLSSSCEFISDRLQVISNNEIVCKVRSQAVVTPGPTVVWLKYTCLALRAAGARLMQKE